MRHRFEGAGGDESVAHVRKQILAVLQRGALGDHQLDLGASDVRDGLSRHDAVRGRPERFEHRVAHLHDEPVNPVVGGGTRLAAGPDRVDRAPIAQAEDLEGDGLATALVLVAGDDFLFRGELGDGVEDVRDGSRLCVVQSDVTEGGHVLSLS